MPRVVQRRASLADINLIPADVFNDRQRSWLGNALERIEDEIRRAANRTDRGLYSLVSGGVENRATAALSVVPGGAHGLAYLHGMMARGAGMFASIGDAQAFDLIWRGVTIDATPAEIFLDGAAARAVLAENATWAFHGLIAARRIDAAAESAAYEVAGLIHRDGAAATTALVGSIAKTVIGETDAALDVAIDADTTNGALRITVTGASAKTIRWVARVAGVEIKD